eukprot:XP_001705122.1 Hypothetical protein GL50803_34654 [Giardia lamblia ATCC 50803]
MSLVTDKGIIKVVNNGTTEYVYKQCKVALLANKLTVQ